MFCYVLNLTSRFVESGASWEKLWYRPRLAIANNWLETTWKGIQSNMYLITVCAGPRDAWGRLHSEPRMAATNTRAQVALQKTRAPQDLLSPDGFHKAQSVIEPHVACELGEVRSRKVTKVGQAMFTRLL